MARVGGICWGGAGGCLKQSPGDQERVDSRNKMGCSCQSVIWEVIGYASWKGHKLPFQRASGLVGQGQGVSMK